VLELAGEAVSNQKCRQCGRYNPPESRFCNSCGNTLTASFVPADGILSPGAVLRGSYVVEDVIGEGGMGVVYRCHHKTLGSQYALKVLEAKLARMEVLRNRFLAEAKIQATVMHPHIVRVMDVIDSDGILAMVMEYIEGKALDEILEEIKFLTPRTAISVALLILDAVGYAHHSGIVHRDLKPSNVMIEEKYAKDAMWKGVKVMDFGIAKLLQEEDRRTMTGVKMGTPRYMAPEQIENAREVDERADVYAIGVTLYELLCGRTPFEELREFELLKAQLTQNPPMMRNFNPNIPERLEAVVMKALEKERDKRYPSAEAFQRALLDLGNNEELKLVLKPRDVVVDLQSNQKLQRKIGKAINKNLAKAEDAQKPKVSAMSEKVKAQIDTASQDAFARTEAELPKAEIVAPAVDEAKVIAKATGKKRTNKAATQENKQDNALVLKEAEIAPGRQNVKVSNDPALVQKRRKSRALFWVLFLMATLLVVGLVYRHYHNMQIVSVNVATSPKPEEAPKVEVDDISRLALKINTTPTGRMVYIPAAKHWISVIKDGKPALKQEKLPSFYIDQSEVSYYHYLKCVNAQKCPPLANPPSSLAMPVSQVGYGTAQAYCEWAGKRLPSAIEWEAAARFGGDADGLSFVNVDCVSTNFAASNRDECFRKNPQGPEPVYSRPQGANVGHLYHMLGNLREWTSTHSQNDKQKYVTKGGSFKSKRSVVSISAEVAQSPNTGAADLGWRCVM
jgi:serine/threonine protein kinase/formylglycine-generating enzyme required for sulfatase activity